MLSAAPSVFTDRRTNRVATLDLGGDDPLRDRVGDEAFPDSFGSVGASGASISTGSASSGFPQAAESPSTPLWKETPRAGPTSSAGSTRATGSSRGAGNSPLFLAIADDDALVPAISSTRLDETWHTAGAPVDEGFPQHAGVRV